MTDPALTLDGFHPEFADLAEWIAGQRTGPIAQRFTPHRIFVAQAIAEIWRCAADTRLTPRARFMAVTRAEALDELAEQIATGERRLALKPDDPERQRVIEQLKAMRWWHAFYGQPRAYRDRDFQPAPSGKVYALNMVTILRFDAATRAAQAEAAQVAA